MGVQFHPEVVHTPQGHQMLANFVFGVCGCTKDWDPKDRLGPLEARNPRRGRRPQCVFLRQRRRRFHRRVHALPPRARARARLRHLRRYRFDARRRNPPTSSAFSSSSARRRFTSRKRSRVFGRARRRTRSRRQKRHIIGEQFVAVQERILSTGHFLDGHWILGQGTIYPDTIESGGTAKADVIKTHHNRVAGIQKLIEIGPDHRAAGFVLQGRSARDRRRVGHSRRVSASPSVPRTGSGDSLFVLGKRSARRTLRSRLAAPHPIGRREGRFAQLSFRAGARNNCRPMRRPPSWSIA